MLERAIFLDKDGTLVENVPYNVDPAKVTFTRGAFEALSLLKEHFKFHIVTNQAGVALGIFEEKELIPLQTKLEDMFLVAGASLSGFHYCPHHPEASCACRKPGTLMFQTAAAKFGIDLRQSWMIGDILDDVEAGKRVGCRTILLDVGNETVWKMNEWREPDFRVKDLSEAAQIILKAQGEER